MSLMSFDDIGWREVRSNPVILRTWFSGWSSPGAEFVSAIAGDSSRRSSAPGPWLLMASRIVERSFSGSNGLARKPSAPRSVPGGVPALARKPDIRTKGMDAIFGSRRKA